MSAKDVDTPRLTGGDRASFKELYRRWRPVVCASARRLLTCDDDADDAVERVFLRILRHPNCIPKAGWNAAYFKRAGRNEALLMLRDAKPHVAISEALAWSLPSHRESPDGALHAEQVRSRLERIADAVPPRCAAVMKLRLNGVSNPNIAQLLGISVKAVEKHAARGRNLLDEAFVRRGYHGLSHFVDGGGGRFDASIELSNTADAAVAVDEAGTIHLVWNRVADPDAHPPRIIAMHSSRSSR